MQIVMSSWPPSATVAMTCSGFTSVNSVGMSRSAPVTVQGPSADTWAVASSISSLSAENTRPFTFKTMSVMSSMTPSAVVNSCCTPSIWMAVAFAPSSDESSTRRMQLPKV